MKRFLKIVAIFMAFATVLAYLMFRVMFFDPFEGEFENTERLVPSNVHFMVRRSNLEEDFSEFPRPEFFEILRTRHQWRVFTKTQHFRELDEKLLLGQKMDDFEAQLEQLGGLIDPMGDILAREVMLLGRHRDDGSLGLVAVFRASNWVKLLADGVRYGFLRVLAGDSIRDYREDGEVAVLTLQDGTEVGLLRRLDLVVVGDDPGLVADVGRLADGKGAEFSLTDSQYYTAAIAEESDFGRPLDIAVDLGEIARQGGWDHLESTEEDSAAYKLFAKTFVPGNFGLTAGRFHLGQRTLMLNLRASADMQAVRADGGGFWSGTSDNAKDLLKFCANVLPVDVHLCGLMRLDIGEFLVRLESCMPADVRGDLSAFVSELSQRPEVGQLRSSSTVELIRKASAYFGNEVVFAFQKQSPYQIPGEEDTIIPLDSWGPRVAILLPVIDRPGAEHLLDQLIGSMLRVGWKTYTWSYGDQYSFREVDNATLPEPSLSAGFIDLEDGDWLVITTTGQFFDEIIKTRMNRKNGTNRGLAINADFQEAIEAVDHTAQGFVYISAKGHQWAMKDLNPWIAKEQNRLDYVDLRTRELLRLRDATYPSERGRPVDPAHERAFEAQLDEYISEQEILWASETIPAKTEELNAELAWAGLFDWTVMTWRGNERDVAFRLFLRSLVEFE